jgi:hypothetical protein
VLKKLLARSLKAFSTYPFKRAAANIREAVSKTPLLWRFSASVVVLQGAKGKCGGSKFLKVRLKVFAHSFFFTGELRYSVNYDVDIFIFVNFRESTAFVFTNSKKVSENAGFLCTFYKSSYCCNKANTFLWLHKKSSQVMERPKVTYY